MMMLSLFFVIDAVAVGDAVVVVVVVVVVFAVVALARLWLDVFGDAPLFPSVPLQIFTVRVCVYCVHMMSTL